MRYIVLKGRALVLTVALSLVIGTLPLVAAAALWTLTEGNALYAELVAGLELPWSLPIYALLGLAVPLALTPAAYVHYVNARYVEALSRQLPTFFKGVADGVRAGMTLERALAASAEAVGDPLKSEINSILAAISLGVPFRDSLRQAAERVPHPVFTRMTSLIAVAYESGGRVADVLSAAAETYGMLRSFEEERRARVAPYVWVTYVALAVFLITATIITAVFVEPLYAMEAPGFVSPPPPHLFKSVFFISAYTQAIFGGLVSGKISRGTVKAGVTHVIAMALIVVAYFYVQENLLEPILAPRF